jgi:hypothetical protein
MDAAVFEALSQVQGAEDEATRARLREESNQALGAHFTHPANSADLEELAYDLLNLTWSDTMAEDIVPRIIEVKTVGLGDPDFVEEDLRGMRAYWQGKGGQILSDIIRYSRAQMPREEIVTAIDWHVDQMALNFWGSFDKLRTQAQEKISQLPTIRLIELIQAAISGGTYYGTFAASTLTATQVDAVVDEVAARSDGQVTIMGTRIAIRALSDIGADFGPNLQEQIFRTGFVAVYKGYPLVQVENFEDFGGNFVLPNDELWFVGKKAGRLTYYGAQAKVQQLQLPSFMRRWETARDAGMLLFGAPRGRIGRIVLT